MRVVICFVKIFEEKKAGFSDESHVSAFKMEKKHPLPNVFKSTTIVIFFFSNWYCMVKKDE